MSNAALHPDVSSSWEQNADQVTMMPSKAILLELSGGSLKIIFLLLHVSCSEQVPCT